ncbi:thioesterase II family protein [Streptomyces pacificus]|uniref:Thioesterase n=1 Tax=Streptomyces pacificus TaxID=2705029 RepID=A0A6A0B2L6_9ACTN|nr:alpha/beta fold hydrolase [Streptomyces pacificus]GFH39559.1 thioesterase [Streptomyces pacificus]
MTASLVTLGAVGPGTTRTLVCVPHAGGSVVAFRGWARVAAAAGLAVRAVHWEDAAGANGRRTSIESRADTLAAELRDLPEPWVLLGHSLGALIAAETARWIEEQVSGSAPERVVLCAAAPPGYPRGFPPGVLTASDTGMAQYVRRLGGTPEEILSDPEFGPQLLTQLRNDLDLIERYEPAFPRPLSSPVSVYGGASDGSVPIEVLDGWRAFAPQARVRVFPGNHFFLHDSPADVCREVAADCARTSQDRLGR